MRLRMGAALGAALVLVVGGCAKPRPCTIIPMQLELVRFDTEQLEEQVATKVAEVNSLRSNLEIATTRMAQMEQEATDLEKAIGEIEGDAGAAGRKK